MRYLADHHISPRTVALLKTDGYDIIRVSDILPQDASDSLILEHARLDGQIVITQDLDYSALLASTGYTRPSVISLRLQNNRPERLASILMKLLPMIEKDLKAGAVVVVEENRFRVRSLPIL